MESTTTELQTFASRLSARVAQGQPESYEPENLDLRLEHQDFPVHLSFVPEAKLLIAVRTVPEHRLLVCAESSLTQHLDQLGISGEVKVGDEEFDKGYVVKNATEAEARETMTPRFIQRLRALEPFLEFEMTTREYRLLKNLEGAVTAAALLETLDHLAEVVRMSAAPPVSEEEA